MEFLICLSFFSSSDFAADAGFIPEAAGLWRFPPPHLPLGEKEKGWEGCLGKF